MKNERDLLVDLKTAKQRLDDVKEAQKDLQAAYDKAETEMVEHLTANQAEATGKYLPIPRSDLTEMMADLIGDTGWLNVN